nr:MAG: hypothetical protein [Bacteriophage sp.]
MVETYYGPKPDPVRVEHLDGRTHVWLVKDAERDTVDRGPDERDSVEVYTGKTLRFTMWGTVSADEVERGFDALWSEHELDGVDDAERIALLAQATADNGKQMETVFQAVAELGDMIATKGGEA